MKSKPASAILIEMAQSILRTDEDPPKEIVYLAILLAQAAWNKSLGTEIRPEFFQSLRDIERTHRGLWRCFRASDVSTLIDRLVALKQSHYPDDHRQIVRCSMTDEVKIRAEWREVGRA